MYDNVNERKEKKRMRLILISYNDIKVITDRASTCGARFLLNAGDFLTVRISLYSLWKTGMICPHFSGKKNFSTAVRDTGSVRITTK